MTQSFGVSLRMALDITSSLGERRMQCRGVGERSEPMALPNVVIHNQVNNEDLQMYRWG